MLAPESLPISSVIGNYIVQMAKLERDRCPDDRLLRGHHEKWEGGLIPNKQKDDIDGPGG
jgi:hypothetical protein